jgi:hypothetical protein
VESAARRVVEAASVVASIIRDFISVLLLVVMEVISLVSGARSAPSPARSQALIRAELDRRHSSLFSP